MKKIVLMYHDVYRCDTSESGFQNSTALKYKVSVNDFENHVAAIDNYLTIHNFPRESVEFTFDDGGVSFLTEAAPILEKHGFRGIFFIATQHIGASGFLSVSQVQELATRGHIIGPHSHSHPERMSALSVDEIIKEWAISQKILEGLLGYKPQYASIPNGYKSKAVLLAMNNNGLKHIYTSDPITKVYNYKDSEVIGRYAITNDYSTKKVMSIVVSPWIRFKHLARFRCLGIAKTLLGEVYLTIRKKIS